MKTIYDSTKPVGITKRRMLFLLEEIEKDINTPFPEGSDGEYPDKAGQLQMLDHLKYTIKRVFN